MMSIAGVVMALALTGAVGMSAESVDEESGPRVSVSYDGVTYTSAPTYDVFGDTGVVVPGDALLRDIWIRNDSSQSGTVRIDLVDVAATDADLAQAMTVSMGSTDSTVRVSDAIADGACLVMANGVVLEPGGVARLPAALRVSPELGDAAGAHGDDGQGGSVSFQFRVILSDVAAPVGPAPGTPCAPVSETPPTQTHQPRPPSDGSLVVTGANGALGSGVAVVGAALAGLVLIGWRRSRSTRE